MVILRGIFTIGFSDPRLLRVVFKIWPKSDSGVGSTLVKHVVEVESSERHRSHPIAHTDSQAVVSQSSSYDARSHERPAIHSPARDGIRATSIDSNSAGPDNPND